MLHIKDIKNSQVFWAKCPNTGTIHDFKAWQNPFERDGVLWIECTDAGDYVFEFNQQDEHMLYLTKECKED